jgi:small subunit ribosomal protein S15
MGEMDGTVMAKKTTKKPADWIELKPEEIEELVVKLYHEGHSKSEIGMILRDQYGVPSVRDATKKSVSEILRSHGIKEELPEDLRNLIKRAVNLREHMDKMKKDFKAKRAYQCTVSKIRALVKYYKKKKVLPETWTYTDEVGKLLVK